MGPTLEGHDMTGIKYKVVLEPFIYFKLFTQKKQMSIILFYLSFTKQERLQ